MAQYNFSPLSREANFIRLLRILPSQDKDANLECELLEYALQESDTAYQPYEALSYVWGSEDKPQTIFVNERELGVTQNLFAALHRLRNRQFSRIIWADAICINQTDIREKEHQIGFMAVVYAKASRVLVWLGESDDDSDYALDLIRAAGEKSILPSDTEAFQQSIIPLLNRPWFHRIWVGSQHPVVKCND
jgi:hypothetical protein